MKPTKEQKNKIWFKMTLRQTNTPYKKIKKVLLHAAMRGDEKARRQLKTLGEHDTNLCKYYLTRV